MQDTRLDTKGGCNPHLGLQVPVKERSKNTNDKYLRLKKTNW